MSHRIKKKERKTLNRIVCEAIKLHHNKKVTEKLENMSLDFFLKWTALTALFGYALIGVATQEFDSE